MTSERKEKVIHTRVPESLDSELRDKAKGLGISMSNLVRNILSNTVGLVEGIVADTAVIARAASGEGAEHMTTPVPVPSRVLGWQECTLSLNAVCDECNDVLTKGAKAAVSVVEGSGPKRIVCLACMENIIK